jgi:cell division protein ZapE
MTLMARYDAAVIAGDILDSLAQRDVLAAFDKVMDALSNTKRSWFCPWREPRIQGLYVYGPVGAGKTYLMDLFYQQINTPQKARYHFHHFMQMIDAELRRVQGKRDPLRYIVRTFAKSVRVLCLDEFLVHDVADAMILTELLQGLLAHGVVFIVTTNTKPDDLYLYGVHRERFLPAIAVIKESCRVILLGAQQDYRLGREPLLQSYLFPLNEAAHQALVQQFDALAAPVTDTTEITVQNRTISCVKLGNRAIWFAFDVICNLPRSQLDYLEIASRFDTVFVSDIPVIGHDDTVKILLLIHFIDVMYDQGIQLIISAATEVNALYVSGPMSDEFKRTRSRLEEMQSADYMRRHKQRE